MFFEHISTEAILFLTLYGITGVVPLIAALYLLLRRGNAFAPDVTPPVRLRRWAASFFAVSALGHVWWMLFYVYSGDNLSMDDLLHSAGYMAILVLDSVAMLTTIAGTLLAMLQNRRRPVWPVFAAMLPFVALGAVLMVWPSEQVMILSFGYVLVLYVLFTVYMVFAVRQYGRWLRDNYADLERKEVWLTHVVAFFFMLLIFFYALVDVDSRILLYLLHIFQLAFFGFLLWRVETLQRLSPLPLPAREGQGGESSIDLAEIERLLTEHCVNTGLYLQHDLSLQQLAHAIGTNRFYLSQYFARQGITYNIYINNLRINHFISRYQEATAAGRVVARELAQESGYHSYSTFSLAFKQRTGQSVTAWMRGRETSGNDFQNMQNLFQNMQNLQE